jgi:replication-associated recombination protein RarA
MNNSLKKNSFLVSGEPGVGKSFFIRQEAKNKNAKLFRWNVRIDRSLREGREILHQQVRSKEALIVWIEGADDLTQEAQAFLRRILETASQSVVSMLEVREPWKMSPPILSRCIPISINNTSYRYSKNYQIAKQLKLVYDTPDLKLENIKIYDIIEFRKKGYDPIHIINSIFKNNYNSEVLNIMKNIGKGFSPWIQLAYYIQKVRAVSSKTNEQSN